MSTESVSATEPRGEQPVALVTGAARRVGAVIARHLAAAGYRLIIHANSSIEIASALAGELSAKGCESIARLANLSDEEAVKRMIEEAHAHFGRIDALVNSAAVWVRKTLDQVTAADVRAHLEINTIGTFLCCQHVGRIMVEQPNGGAIVNVGDWAIARPYLDYAAYFPSKGSIPTLTRMFAVELANRNPRIRVNAVLPGPVMLPADLSAEEREQSISGTLLKREGTPQHVADAVLFLLRNDFVTGACLPVDGGRSVYVP